MTAETAVLRDDLVSEMNELGRAARAAAAELAIAGPEQRNNALKAAAEALRNHLIASLQRTKRI